MFWATVFTLALVSFIFAFEELTLYTFSSSISSTFCGIPKIVILNLVKENS